MKKLITGSVLALASTGVFAGPPSDCPVTYEQLKNALTAVIAENNGLGFDMWATVVNRSGRICAVARTGADLADQWLASRVISAQKAFTVVSLSNNKGSFGVPSGQSFAFTSAGLWQPAQPGGSLFELANSNPVDATTAYAGNSNKFGTENDPLVGRTMGGINVFGGGVALFDANDQLVGGLGVSGNTSCADHNIAWRVRNNFRTNGIAQGADFEIGINYTAPTNPYPACLSNEREIFIGDGDLDADGFGIGNPADPDFLPQLF